MVSMASRYAHGELVWEVVHDPSSSPSELRISGSSPPELAAVRDRASRGGVGAGNNFEIPIDLADEVCGFRHDAIRPDWKMVMFTVAVPNRPQHADAASEAPTMVARTTAASKASFPQLSCSAGGARRCSRWTK